MSQSASEEKAPVVELNRLTVAELAKRVDHTALKAFVTVESIERLCAEAAKWDFASVCVNPVHVTRAAEALADTDVKVCTVIGFPLGASKPAVKGCETDAAVEDGAREIDMVLNVGALRGGDDALVEQDVRTVVEAAQGNLVKVILETCYLTDPQIERACRLCVQGGADYVKTSTGFGAFGAFERHVRLMRETVGNDIGVKASGGIGDFRAALRMLAAGASRLGVSAGIAIVQGFGEHLASPEEVPKPPPCEICPTTHAVKGKVPDDVYAALQAACAACPHKP